MTMIRIRMETLLEALLLEDAPRGLNSANQALVRLPLLVGGRQSAKAVRRALKFGTFKVMRHGL